MDEQIIKDFLRIDGSEDISFFIEAATEYVKEAVGIVDFEDSLTRYAVCMITQELYDHRTYTGEYGTNQQNRVRHAAHSILEQIRLRNNLAEEETDEG